MDIGKALMAALIPTVILIVIGLLQLGIGAIPFLGILTLCTGLPLLFVSWVVMTYAGFAGAKANQNDFISGTISGTFAGTIAGLVVSIAMFVLTLLGVGYGVAAGGSDLGGAAWGAGIGVFGIVWGVGWGFIQGLICGLIGAAIAVIMK